MKCLFPWNDPIRIVRQILLSF